MKEKEFELIINLSNDLLKKIMDEILPKKNEVQVEDAVILGLFNSIIEKSKSILILYQNQHYPGTDAILRSIFETSVILKFILKQHTEDRAEAYFLSTYLKLLEYAEFISNSDNRRLIKKYYPNLNISEFEEIIKEDKHNEYREKFFQLTLDRRSDKWLKIQKLNNFKELCKYIGDETYLEYETFYRMISQEAHGKEFSKYYDIEENSFVLTQKEPSIYITNLNKFLIETSTIIAKKYNLSNYYTNIKKAIL